MRCTKFWLPLISACVLMLPLAAMGSVGRSAENLLSAPLPAATWKNLVSFRPSTDVQEAVRARGENWAVHRIDDRAIPDDQPVNLDYYSIRVAKLPLLPDTDRRMTPAELLRYMGDALISSEYIPEQRRLVKFSPLTEKDRAAWSRRETGAVLLLDFYASASDFLELKGFQDLDFCEDLGWLGDNAACRSIESSLKEASRLQVNVDDGCIVLSQASPQEFRVSTIRAGSGATAGLASTVAGAHPVSGNRAFGYSRTDNGYVFYVMGADRATNTPMGLAELERNVRELSSRAKEDGFRLADLWWRTYIAAVRDFVNANDGDAELGKLEARRTPWQELISERVFDPEGTDQPSWE